MAPEEALRYAKKEIMAAEPVAAADPDLYAPLFKNVSQFKRSYQLMERILKVYIYQDGRRPIFHTPPLSGIYASEGWFMKLLKKSRPFVVADAAKAHLFYLPYSSQNLRLSLYVPDSHNLRPLAVYLRDFVKGLAAKYPFWNRTRGADHFLVACHDWGPYTTTAHRDLSRNSIKALCNADSSEGIFTPGKDVSLPETTIRTPNRTPRRPLRYVGGLPISRRHILAFFAGNVHGRVRPVLLQHWGKGQDEDMRVYALLPGRVSRTMTYIDHMKNSRFCLCPMGYEVNSPRIVEALYYECVPVIIADNFVLPFSDVLDWSAFSVVVAEKDIPDLKKILQGISLRRYVAMHDCVKRLQRHFLWHARPLRDFLTSQRSGPRTTYDHAEEISRGDERACGERYEGKEGQPHRAGDLPVEGVLTEPRHPQIVARRGSRRRGHEEIRQDLQQSQEDDDEARNGRATRLLGVNVSLA
uniref:Exostosin-1 n=1 Tax=Aegilops tauschii TaxID=37682 RepID=M8CPL6_AEGTA